MLEGGGFPTCDGLIDGFSLWIVTVVRFIRFVDPVFLCLSVLFSCTISSDECYH